MPCACYHAPTFCDSKRARAALDGSKHFRKLRKSATHTLQGGFLDRHGVIDLDQLESYESAPRNRPLDLYRNLHCSLSQPPLGLNSIESHREGTWESNKPHNLATSDGIAELLPRTSQGHS